MTKRKKPDTRRTAVRPVSRPAYGTPAWQARSKCTSLRIALIRARQLAAEDERGVAYGQSRGWSTSANELLAERSARRVQRTEERLAAAVRESERLA